jgi:hypothetical protein
MIVPGTVSAAVEAALQDRFGHLAIDDGAARRGSEAARES